MNFFLAILRSSSVAVSTTRLKFSSGNFASTGTRFGPILNDGVHSLSALEPVLERVMGRRKDLGQEVAEKKLAQAAAQFGRAQDLLQARDVLADVEHLLGRLAQAAESLAHFLHHACGVVQPAVQISRGFLELLGDLVQLSVHLERDLAELLVHRLLALEHGIGQLAAERLHFLLHEGHGGVNGLLPGLEHEPEEDQDDCCKEYEDGYVHSIIRLMSGIEVESSNPKH